MKKEVIYKSIPLKQIQYILFAFVFHLCKIFPVNPYRIVFLCMHNETFEGSLMDLYQEFQRRDEKYTYYILNKPRFNKRHIFGTLKAYCKFYFQGAKMLATASFIFMNDNFMPMAYLRFKKRTTIVQLWHAEGAFKKFGQDIPVKTKVRKMEVKGSKRFTYVVASSENTAPLYANAFGVDTEKVIPVGSIRIDRLFKENTKLVRKQFDRQYPYALGRTVVLVAPTFRDDQRMDEAIMDHIDPVALSEKLGEGYMLLVRLHPQINHAKVPEAENIVNVTEDPDINRLIMVSDVLVTDYSSLVTDFALLDKPIVLYPYDMEEYLEKCRGFYFDYDFVGGTIARDLDDVAQIIRRNRFDMEKIREFADFQQAYRDGKSAERLVDFLM